MVTVSNDVDEIYHRMAEIRRERHKHVSESVAGAEAVIDWGRYTWTYPWIALGAAAAVGYLVYTGRHPRVRASDASPADGVESYPVAGTAPRVWITQASAGVSWSPLGISCCPWPSVRARITCCIGSSKYTRRGR